MFNFGLKLTEHVQNKVTQNRVTLLKSQKKNLKHNIPYYMLPMVNYLYCKLKGIKKMKTKILKKTKKE